LLQFFQADRQIEVRRGMVRLGRDRRREAAGCFFET
jgi:hypothetical protein